MNPPRSMGLGALADVIGPEEIRGLPIGTVRGLAYDSRDVDEGTLFFAVPGEHVDGHRFAHDAVAAGAIALVVERALDGMGVPQLIVDRSRRALADAADAWFGRPSERLTVVGITGTDGKSTTAALTAEVLRACGRRAGEIGTVFVAVGGERRPNLARNTTPEALELQGLLSAMVAAGDDSVVMEATSHGLALERTRNCRFDIGAVTTITSEHLDFHGSIEAYRDAKARLVEEAPIAILNADDSSFGFLRGRARERVLSYAVETDADLRATALEPDAAGTSFHLEAPGWRGSVRIGLPGRFNVSNALATLAIADALGLDLAAAAAALAATSGVPGRMEAIDQGQPFAVVVDYAHTADALGKVLDILRPLTAGRLIVVFGSAGERDRAKRPVMGRVAAQRADLVIVTDEDPRLEDPRAINEEIAAGARTGGARDGETLWVIDDRDEAISHALKMARAGDVLLLAGKGHEASMIYGETKRPWDDREAARRALRAAGYAPEA